jgi:type II secretory pathway pseudopilin PulG
MKRQHFTLVELLVVIGLITILAGILIPAVNGALKKADETKAKAQITTLLNAIKQFEATYGYLPEPNRGSNYHAGEVITYDNSGTGHSHDQDIYSDLIALLQGYYLDPNKTDYESKIQSRQNLYSEQGNYQYNTNSRFQQFLEVVDDNPGQYQDPWGNNFNIIFDNTGDGRIQLPTGSAPGADHGLSGNPLFQSVAIWSLGAKTDDDENDRKDNIYSFPVKWDKSSKKYKIGH